MFGRVSARSAADAAPNAAERWLDVGVLPQGAPSATVHRLPLDGLTLARPAVVPSRSALLGAVIILGALGVIVLFASPAAGWGGAWIDRVIWRAAATQPARARGRPSIADWVRRGGSAAIRDGLPAAHASAVLDMFACAWVAALPMGDRRAWVRTDPEVCMLWVASASACLAFVASPTSALGLRAALHIVWQHVPAAMGAACAVLLTGSLRLHEIAHAQGGSPWDWLLFQSPACLPACAAVFWAARIDPRPERLDTSDPGARLVGLAYDARSDSRAPAGPWLRAACRARCVVLAGLVVTLFLGGWALPGIGDPAQAARPPLLIAATLWFCFKVGACVVLIAMTRWALPPLRLSDASYATLCWSVPLMAFALSATALWLWLQPSAAVQCLVSRSLAVWAALFALAVSHRLHYGLSRSDAQARVSAFL
jgi:hypothetical protein